MVPIILALHRLRGQHHDLDERWIVPTVPPGQPLPLDVSRHLHWLKWRATLPQWEARTLARQGGPSSPGPRRTTRFDDSTDARLDAAISFLIAGDEEGLEWRAEVWSQDSGQWKLTEDVLRACRNAPIDYLPEVRSGPLPRARGAETLWASTRGRSPLSTYSTWSRDSLLRPRLDPAARHHGQKWSNKVNLTSRRGVCRIHQTGVHEDSAPGNYPEI